MLKTNTDNLCDLVLYDNSVLIFSFSLHYTFTGGHSGFIKHFQTLHSMDKVQKIICYYVDTGNTLLIETLNSYGGDLFQIDLLSDDNMKVKLPFSGNDMYEESRIYSSWFEELDDCWTILEHSSFGNGDHTNASNVWSEMNRVIVLEKK